MDIAAVQPELRMGLDPHPQVQVARGCGTTAPPALSRQPDALPVCDARRDVDLVAPRLPGGPGQCDGTAAALVRLLDGERQFGLLVGSRYAGGAAPAPKSDPSRSSMFTSSAEKSSPKPVVYRTRGPPAPAVRWVRNPLPAPAATRSSKSSGILRKSSPKRS